MQVRGSTCDSKGNRKFKLEIVDNNQIIFKPKKGVEFICQLPKLNKKLQKTTASLEELCNTGKACFTCSVKNNSKFG